MIIYNSESTVFCNVHFFDVIECRVFKISCCYMYDFLSAEYKIEEVEVLEQPRMYEHPCQYIETDTEMTNFIINRVRMGHYNNQLNLPQHKKNN